MRIQPNPEIRITGTGRSLPDQVVDNARLEGMIRGYDPARSGPFGAWVDQVSHIHERRFGPFEMRSSDLALGASRQAILSAGLEPKDIGLIVYASFTLSQVLPGDHCLLAQELGIPTVPTFNLMAACAGSIYGLGVAYGMVAAGMYEHVLVVGAETISKIINYHDPLTAILFGDGAGAAVVSRRRGPEGTGMLPPLLGSHFSARTIHLGNSNMPVEMGVFPERSISAGVPLVEQALIEMEGGPSVLRTAVLHMASGALRILGYEEADLKRKDPSLLALLERVRVVPHQANGRILDGVAERLRLPPQRVTRTLYRYGNISAASNLVALDYAIRDGNMERAFDEKGGVLGIVDHPEERIRPGEIVVMPSIGGGYLTGCAAFVA